MPFDMGFDFRGNAFGLTDPDYAVLVAQDAYPHTFTNVNGDSVNAGWTTGPGGAQNVDDANDVRIAGNNYSRNDGVPDVFKVDLSSGSAPGAGPYTIDVAAGDPVQTRNISFRLLDDATVLIDGTGPIATATDHFVDATLADVAATTTWTGATASKTFASTTANLEIGTADETPGFSFTTLAHFRLTLVEDGAALDSWKYTRKRRR